MCRRIGSFVLYLALTGIVAGCGSGSSEMPTTAPGPLPGDQGGGTQPLDVVSTGVITGFGSIFVNGVEYATDSAVVATDETGEVGESRLEVGMVVTVDGHMDADGRTGEATQVHYGDFMVGPVDTIDAANLAITMMGRQVNIDELSVMDGVDLDNLAPGTLVEVSGYRLDHQTLDATRLALANGTAQSRSFGQVASLDATATTFILGDMPVDYQGASLPATPLADGMMVVVTGDIDAGGRLVATHVIARETIQHAAGEHMVIEGIVGEVGSGDRFTVDGQTCVLGDGVAFDDGMTRGDLVPQARLHLEGVVGDDGTLVVTQASMHRYADFTMMGTVMATDPASGTVTVGDMTFTVDSQTLYMDALDHMRSFNLAGISTGETLEVHAEQMASGGWMAISIDRTTSDQADLLVFAGMITAIDAAQSRITLLDREVTLDAATRIVAADGSTLSLNAFFAGIQVGDSVTVKASASGDQTLALEIAIGRHGGMMMGM